jgi:hypothetical protein
MDEHLEEYKKNIKLASRLKGVRFDEDDFKQASDSIFET